MHRHETSICKRTLDVLLSIVGLIVAAPLMLAISLLVYLDDPGPVFFSQKRLGQHGEVFRLHKFRKFAAILGDKEKGPGVTVRADARMTRIGRLLERTKLDELPQLWNILKGEMSFVGPRPESLRYTELFVGDLRRVLEFRPGIFGPNQIAYRNEADMYPADEMPEAFYRRELFPQKAKNDIDYFSRATCFRDMQWVLKGLWVSLIGAVPWRRFVGLHAGILLVDVIMVMMAWLGAYMLRYYDFSASAIGLRHLFHAHHIFVWDELLDGLVIMPSIVIASMLLGGCYRVPVRHFSLPDAIRLFWSAGIGWMLAFLTLIGMAVRSISILLFPIGGALAMGLLFLPRILARRRDMARSYAQHQDHRHRILIYGGSVAGTAIARWLHADAPDDVRLVGFLDDDPALLNRSLVDARVLGRESDLPVLKDVHDVTDLWVTFRPDDIKRQRLSATCEALGISLFYIADVQPFSLLGYQKQTDTASVEMEGTLESID